MARAGSASLADYPRPESGRRHTDDVLRHGRAQCESSRCDSFCSQMPSEPVEGPFDPHAGGILRQTQRSANFGEGFLLKVAEQERVAFSVAKLSNRFVQKGADLLPIRH